MGHFRRDCKGKLMEDLSEDFELQRSPPAYTEDDASLIFLKETSGVSTAPQHEPESSLTGNLQALCPLLFKSLSSEEKLAINYSDWLLTNTLSKTSLPGLDDSSIEPSLLKPFLSSFPNPTATAPLPHLPNPTYQFESATQSTISHFPSTSLSTPSRFTSSRNQPKAPLQHPPEAAMQSYPS